MMEVLVFILGIYILFKVVIPALEFAIYCAGMLFMGLIAKVFLK